MNAQSKIFFTEDFHDFGTYLKNAQRWQLDFRKLDKGSFYGKISMVDLDTVQILRTQLKGVIDQVGQMQKGYRTFVVPAENLAMAYWMDTKLAGDELIVFPKHGGFEAVSYDKFDVFAISIKEHHLHELALQCSAEYLDTHLTEQACVYRMDEKSNRELQSLLHHIFKQIYLNPEHIHSTDFIFDVNYKLPFTLINFLNHPNIEKVAPLSRKRDKALTKCVKYIRQNLNRRITLGEISKEAKASERTLEYAFKERYGISPKTYITYSKLNKIKNLLSNPKNMEKVSTIAKEFGFKHMGQFAADYKNLLGELPRYTLLNSK